MTKPGKYIAIENLSNVGEPPRLWRKDPLPIEHNLKMWLGDVIRESFYGEPVTSQRVGPPPLRSSDPDVFIVYVIGGDQYQVSSIILESAENEQSSAV